MSFDGAEFRRPGDCFGGSLLKGNPKTARPLDSKLPVHLTLRTAGSWLRRPKTYKSVNEIVQATARKHGMKIYRYANVGNHLHVVLKISRRHAWAAFIRELTGRIAQWVREAMGLAADSKFWLFRPFTRIVRGWQRPFQLVKEYIALNLLEADGFISRRETKTLKDLRALFDG